MKRILILVALGAALVLTACGDEGDDAATPPAPAQEKSGGSEVANPPARGENEDLSGNCDEAEHADDPECANTGGVGVGVGDGGGNGDGGSDDGSSGGGGVGTGGGSDSGTGGVGAYGG